MILNHCKRFAVVVILLLSFASSYAATTPIKAKIQGKITNMESLSNRNISGMELWYKDLATNREEKIKVHVNYSGDFSAEIPAEFPINVELKYNWTSSIMFVLEPRQTIIVRCEINQGRLSNPNFFGPLKKLNRVVAAYSNERIGLIGQSYADLAMILQQPEKAKKISYELYERISEGVDNLLIEMEADAESTQWVRQDMQYELYRNLLRAELDNVRKSPTDLPDNCCRFLDSLFLNFDPAIMSNSYVDLINEVRNFMYLNISKAMHPTELAMKEITFYEMNLSKKAKDILLTNTIMQHLQSRNELLLQSYLPLYFKEVKTYGLKQRAQASYDKIKDYMPIDLTKPTPLPETDRLIADSKILEEIRAKHKGKIVYIDFWATWCKPCVRQFEHSRRLKQEMQYKDVAFVYFCAMSKEDAWQKMVKEHDLAGDHYLLNDEEYASLSKIFAQRGFPHYSLLDANGIIAYRNAKRPSEMGELMMDMQSLLE